MICERRSCKANQLAAGTMYSYGWSTMASAFDPPFHVRLAGESTPAVLLPPRDVGLASPVASATLAAPASVALSASRIGLRLLCGGGQARSTSAVLEATLLRDAVIRQSRLRRLAEDAR